MADGVSHGAAQRAEPGARYRPAAHPRDLLASTTWLKGAFSTETEVAANQGGPPGDDPSARMVRLGAHRFGGARALRHDLSHGGPGFLSGIRPRAEGSLGRVEERSDGYSQRRRTTDSTSKLTPQGIAENRVITGSMCHGARLHGRIVAFSYAQNAASTTMDPFSLFPQRADHHRFEAAVGYRGVMWDAKLASSYGLETDLHAAMARRAKSKPNPWRPRSVR